jgi:catechol O-methyltransferase
MVKASPAIIGFGVREGTLTLLDKLTGKPSRPRRVLEYIRANTDSGDPAGALQAMDQFAREQRFLMNVGDIKGKILIDALKKSGAGCVLELGTYCGYSAILMAQALGESGSIDSLEINPDFADTARKIIAYTGLESQVTVHVGSARSLIPTLGKDYQLVFIDHGKGCYLPDLQAIEEFGVISGGSYVVADNVGLFDASGYLDHMRDSGLYTNTNFEAHMEYTDTIFDAVEVSVMKGPMQA